MPHFAPILLVAVTLGLVSPVSRTFAQAHVQEQVITLELRDRLGQR